LWEGPRGIRIIPGGSGIARLAAANPVEIEGIIEGFRALDGESDWLLIDTGAGIAPNVMSFVLAADEVLVVTTPEPTALADAYGLIKAIWESHEVPLLRLVVNRAEGLDRSERMGRRLIELATRMLAIDVAWAGLIQEDPRVPMAIARQTPFVLAYPGTIASRDIQGLAARLLQSRSAPLQGASTMGRFIERLRSTFSQLAEAERGSD
jgi:flagellar biosynthesis protein FlhG